MQSAEIEEIDAAQGISKKKSDRLRAPFILSAPNSVEADKIGISDGELITQYASDAVVLIKLRDALQKIVDTLTPKVPETTIAITHFKNWGETQDSLLLHVKPTEADQVIAFVKGVLILNENSETKVKIGMGGSYHTWSSTYPDQMGLLVNTCNLKLAMEHTTDGYRRINLNDGEPRTVTISPGVTNGELMTLFLKYKICFESDALLPTVTYGGIFSGGGHGTGKDQQSLSDWVVSMKVVDGNAKVRHLPDDCGTNRDDILKAAQVNLGLFGVVLEYTAIVKPMSNCKVDNIFSMNLKDVVPRDTISDDIFHIEHTKKMAELLEKYWSVELFWFPFNSVVSRFLNILPKNLEDSQLILSLENLFVSHPLKTLEAITESIKTGSLMPLLWSPWEDNLWVRGIDIDRERKEDITQEPGIPFWSRALDIATATLGKYALAPMTSILPSSTPISLLVGFELVKLQYGTFQTDEVVRTPWAIHYRDGVDLMRVYDLEFAFPINIKNPVKAVQAIRKVVDIVQKYAYEGKFTKQEDSDKDKKIRFPLSLCMEMRVIKKSDTLLCPASLGDEENVAYVEVLSMDGTHGYKEFFTEVALEWIKLGGVPHWQKQWDFLQNVKSPVDIFTYLRGKYAKNMDTFMQVYRDLNVDPNGIFMNETMKKLLLNE